MPRERRGSTKRIVVVALALAASAGTATAQQQLAGYTAALLARGAQNHLIAGGYLNGRAATFMIDTGSDISFLQRDRAAAADVRAGEKTTRRSGKWFPVGRVNDLRIGDVALGASEFALYDSAELRGPIPGRGGKPVDGVIGLDVLRRHQAVINCHTRQLFLRRDSSAPIALPATTRALGFTRVPLEEARGGYLTVPCAISGKPGKLVLDTGAFLSALDDEIVRNIGLPVSASKLTARGYDGRVRPVAVVEVERLTIGGVAIAPQKVVAIDVFPKKQPVRAFTGMGRIESYPWRDPNRREPVLFGLLGNELLFQRSAIIDLAGMALYLK